VARHVANHQLKGILRQSRPPRKSKISPDFIAAQVFPRHQPLDLRYVLGQKAFLNFAARTQDFFCWVRSVTKSMLR